MLARTAWRDVYKRQVDHIFGSSIKLSVALLTAETLDLCHGNALNPHFRQCRSDIVELEGFDDGNDHFHTGKPPERKVNSLPAVSYRICAWQHGVFGFSDV